MWVKCGRLGQNWSEDKSIEINRIGPWLPKNIKNNTFVSFTGIWFCFYVDTFLEVAYRMSQSLKIPPHQEKPENPFTSKWTFYDENFIIMTNLIGGPIMLLSYIYLQNSFSFKFTDSALKIPNLVTATLWCIGSYGPLSQRIFSPDYTPFENETSICFYAVFALRLLGIFEDFSWDSRSGLPIYSPTLS